MSDFNQTKPCQCGKLMILVDGDWRASWKCQCGLDEAGPIIDDFLSIGKQIEFLRWQMANLVTPAATNAIPMGNRAKIEMLPANR